MSAGVHEGRAAAREAGDRQDVSGAVARTVPTGLYLMSSIPTQPPHSVRDRAGPVRRGVPGDDGVRAQEGLAGDHTAHRARRGALVARAGDEQAACQGEVLSG